MSDTQQTTELFRRIQSLLGMGHLREARDQLIHYCRINSGDTAAWGMLGQLHGRYDEFEQAVNCLEHVLTLTTGNATVHMQLAICQKRLGRLQDAVRHCRAALEINPDPIEWWWELGDLSAQLENYPVVEQCCRAVLDRDATISAAHLYLGIALQRQGRLREAEEELRTAIVGLPGAPDAYFNLGLVLQSLGDSVEALQHYRNALHYGMESGTILHNIALLHYQQGRPGDALDFSFRALQHEPGILKYRQLFVRALHTRFPDKVSEAMLSEILRCFNCRGIDSIYLMKPGMMLLMRDAKARQLLEQAGRGEYDRISEQIGTGEYDSCA